MSNCRVLEIVLGIGSGKCTMSKYLGNSTHGFQFHVQTNFGFRQKLRGSGHGHVGWEYSLRDIKLMWLHWYLKFRLFGVHSSGNLKEGRNLRTQDFPVEMKGLALSVL